MSKRILYAEARTKYHENSDVVKSSWRPEMDVRYGINVELRTYEDGFDYILETIIVSPAGRHIVVEISTAKNEAEHIRKAIKRFDELLTVSDVLKEIVQAGA